MDGSISGMFKWKLGFDEALELGNMLIFNSCFLWLAQANEQVLREVNQFLEH